MYSVTLRCLASEAETVAAALWDYGALALSETTDGEVMRLVAGFENADGRENFDTQFHSYAPVWTEDNTDWLRQSQAAWPARAIGERLWLAPVWNTSPTPNGRLRITHNPGMASGTGEHPCTRLMLQALERNVQSADTVLDVGTGSGILALAAAKLGAHAVIAVDTDPEALVVARDHCALNEAKVELLHGSANLAAPGWASLTVANIAGTVLLSIWDELLAATATGGKLILSGFTVDEARTFESLLPVQYKTQEAEWVCLESFQQ